MPGNVIRYYLRHPDRGIWLGLDWWMSGPEAKQVNNIPTFTVDDTAFIMKFGIEGMQKVLVPGEVIDMKDNRISEDSAVRYGIVPRPWMDKGVVA